MPVVLIGFGPLPRPVLFDDGAERLLDGLEELIRGWDHARVANGEPAFTVSRGAQGWRIDAPWHEQPIVESCDFRAAAHLAVDLVEAWLAAHPERLSLHCASAVFGDRLVLFPGRSHAGKSTLAARLAADDLAILSDDLLVLGTDHATGVSLGQAPRVRLPLPSGASSAFQSFVARHAHARDADYAYLRMPEPIAPRFGRSVPIGGVCLLDRRERGPARLLPATAGDGMASLLLQVLSPELSAADAMPALERLLRAVPCFTLEYCDLDEAVSCLARGLAAFAPLDPSEPLPAKRQHPEPRSLAASGEHHFLARDDIRLHLLGDEAFLVDPASDAVFRLNLLSLGLWNLLQQPTGPEEATAILTGAFEETDPEAIAADVADFFAAMAERGLIGPVPES